MAKKGDRPAKEAPEKGPADQGPAAAKGEPAGGEAEASPEGPALPSKWQRVATPGTAVALGLAIIFVYYAWGMAFEPGGTGSNVVLGLLMAAALLYLIAANLGPFLDQAFFTRGDPKKAELLRELVHAIEDFEKLADRVGKGKEKSVPPESSSRLRKEAAHMRTIWVRATTMSKDEEAVHLLTETLQGAQTVAEKVFGKAKGGFLTQLRSLSVAFAIALALRAFVVEPFQIPSGSMIPTLLVGDHLFVARFWYGLSVPFVAEPDYLVRWGVPEPGDVVVFVAPDWVGHNAGDDWIKRVVAGPGQKVRIRDNVIYVDDEPYRQLGEGDRVSYMDHEEGSHRWRTKTAFHYREVIPQDVGEPEEHSVFYDTKLTEDWPYGRTRLNGLMCTELECTVEEGHIFVMGDNRRNSRDGRQWGAVPIDNVKGKALFIWMSVDGSERSVDLGRFTLPAFRWDRLFDRIE